jgi:hypothetical protein
LLGYFNDTSNEAKILAEQLMKAQDNYLVRLRNEKIDFLGAREA